MLHALCTCHTQHYCQYSYLPQQPSNAYHNILAQDWFEAEKPPTAAFARCKVCKSHMVLILQLNAELPDRFPGHERRIYVFACRKATCRRQEGSIRALRGVRVWEEEVKKAAAEKAAEEERKAEAAKPKEAGPGLGDALFGATSFGASSSSGASANPFSAGGNPFGSSASANPFGAPAPQPSSSTKDEPEKPKPTEATPSTLSKTFAETLSLNTEPAAPPPAPEPWPETSAQPKPYTTLYVSEADYETLEPTSSAVPENARLEDADAPEPSMLDREAFESTMDAAFQKFADRMAQNPDQVIRYEFAGAPLLYSKTDAVGQKLSKSTMPGCPNCGGRRTFEVQLTPNAIAELEADDLSLEGMEWGTILVGVCEGDCRPRQTGDGEAGYLEEWAGVQWEELSKGN